MNVFLYALSPILVFSLAFFWGLHVQGVGLKLDDAITFWKAEFSRKVSFFF